MDKIVELREIVRKQTQVLKECREEIVNEISPTKLVPSRKSAYEAWIKEILRVAIKAGEGI